jgi:serine/threonine-protein kinase
VLKAIELDGGTVEVLCRAPEGRGGTWSQADEIVFAPDRGEGLYRIYAAGGSVTPVTRLDMAREEASHRWPYFLSDGRHFLFSVVSARVDVRGVYVGSLDSPTYWKLVDTSSNAVFVPPDTLLYERDGLLRALSIDERNLRLERGSFIVADKVGITPYLRGLFSASRTDVLVYGGSSESGRLVWVDREGREIGQVGSPGSYLQFELSPDAGTVAAARIDSNTGTTDLWLFGVKNESATQFTFSPGNDGYPLWAQDGESLVFASDRSGVFELYQKATVAVDYVESFLETGRNSYPTDWSRDGSDVLYSERSAKGDLDLWSYSILDGETAPVVQTPAEERQARWSPDGKWLAYVAGSSGEHDVFLHRLPVTDDSTRLSSQGGFWPTWSSDGRELYYIDGDGKLVAVTMEGSEVGTSEKLFEMDWGRESLLVAKPYAAVDGGRRFLVHQRAPKEAPSSFTVVVHWRAFSNDLHDRR